MKRKSAKFRKAHYEAVAQVLRKALTDTIPNYQLSEARPSVWNVLKQDLGTMFVADNPNFDRGRFEEACEP